MSIPASGAISASSMQTIFYNGTGSVSMVEMYKGGSKVPNISENANVPASGTISFSHFYGTRKTAAVANAMMVCYSMRLYNASYGGPVVRVRRSTDNVQSDFYTDSTQSYLSTGAGNTGTSYASWISSGTGYITTWYDQSGNGNNAANATASQQPSIYISSTSSNKYVVSWDRSRSTVLNINTPIQPKTMFTQAYWTINTNTDYGTIISSQYDFGQRFNGSVNGASNGDDWYASGTGTKLSYVNGVATTTHNPLNAWNTISLSMETPNYATSSITSKPNYATNGPAKLFKLGADGWSASQRSITGYMSEIIMHHTPQTASDMTTYYSGRILG